MALNNQQLSLSKAELSRQHALLIAAGIPIVEALGRTLAPLCEVVLHDLTKPEASIVAIENPLSGRAIGDSTTELGLARISDPSFPDIVQNYPNSFPDGRPAKSTSIGLRDASGRCVAAICLNLDISLLASANRAIDQLIGVETKAPLPEALRHRSLEEIHTALDSFALRYGTQPRALGSEQRHAAIQMLEDSGLLKLRGSPAAAAAALGVSRATFYNSLKKGKSRV